MVRFLAFIHSKFHEKIKELSEEKRKQFNTVTNELYEALPIMDGIGDLPMYSDWTDSDYVAERFMNLAIKAKDLEKRFHKYINVALNILNKKALLFILDDCDVNIEKTFEILETIRLYFTSPQIIVVMTGDIMLYGMTVRQNYWKFFNKDFLDKECGGASLPECEHEAYRKMVLRLEAQYLQKMIKPEHRIMLDNVYEKYYYNSYSIGIKFTGSGEYKDLRHVYKEIFTTLNMVNANSNDLFVNHLLRQPFRNQYRLLLIYNDFLLWKNNSTHEEKETENINLADRIMKVFEVYINQHSANNKYLKEKTSMYAVWIMKFLIDNNIVSTGSRLLPNMGSDSLNNAIMALGVSCTSQMQMNLSITFDYLIRVSFIRKVLNLLEEDGKKLTDFVHLYTGTGVTKSLGYILAYMNPKMNIVANVSNKTIAGVMIPTRGISNKTGIKGLLIDMVQLSTMSSDMHRTNMCTIYRVIAAIAELLNEYENQNSNENFIYSTFKMKFLQIAKKQTYVEPNVLRPNRSKSQTDKLVYDIDINYEDEDVDEFIKDLYSWMDVDKNKKRKSITPQTLDRTFSLLYNTLNDIDDGKEEDNAYIGDYMSKWVISLWNSCIVAECIDYNTLDDINLSYNKDIVRIFLKNYNSFNKKIEEGRINKDLSFSSWILDCPLLRCYVNTNILALQKDDLFDVDGYNMIKIQSEKELLTKQIEVLDKTLEDIKNAVRELERNILYADELESIDKQIEIIDMELGKRSNAYTRNQELIEKRTKLKIQRLSVSRNVTESGIILYEQRRKKLIEQKNINQKLQENNKEFERIKKIINDNVDESYIDEIKLKASEFTKYSVYTELSK